MADWKKLSISVLLADGKVDATEIKILKKELWADGKIDAEEMDFLNKLRTTYYKKKGKVDPKFEAFYREAFKKNLLADGKIDATETSALKKLLGKPTPNNKKFLTELKKATTKTNSPEFERLCTTFGV
jgi:hypothetical protein